jgi:putative flavoprotein involved in K+ transport
LIGTLAHRAVSPANGGARLSVVRAVDVVVVGAGQAGLATSYWLSARGIEHVVLERARVAESWRTRRWDSFTLVGPNWSFDLPEYPYRGPDPEGFMGRAEMVTRFEAYAQQIRAPIESGVNVERLARDDSADRYRLHTSAGEVSARAVVVASGAYQRPHRMASSFDPSIVQLHADEYRNAAALPEGGVLVIGSGQSGAQIAEDLRVDGRSVWLATGSAGWMPRRYRGRDNVSWRELMGVFDQTVDEVGYQYRLTGPPMQTGTEGGRDINLPVLAAKGVTLTGRFLAADGTLVHFANDLPANEAGSDQIAQRFLQSVDDYIAQHGIDAPPSDEGYGADRAPLPAGPTELDLRREEVSTVIWASGYRLDYGWIDLDLGLTREGYPSQDWGVSPHPGLYFIGLQLMHTRKSGLIWGVGRDAEHITAVLADHLGISGPG